MTDGRAPAPKGPGPRAERTTQRIAPSVTFALALMAILGAGSGPGAQAATRPGAHGARLAAFMRPATMDPLWRGSLNGTPLSEPLVVRSRIPYLPIVDLVRAIGAAVQVSTPDGAQGTIALTTGDGTPPAPAMGAPASVLLSQADVTSGFGSGYRRTVTNVDAPSPVRADTPSAPLPGLATARIATATLTATPVTPGPGVTAVSPGSPSLFSETATEYSGAGFASQAFEALIRQTGEGGVWPGVTAPPPLASLTGALPPVGNQDRIWQGPTPLGPAVLAIFRVNNWIVTAVSVYPSGSPVAPEAALLGPVFDMQASRIEGLPTAGPTGSGSEAPAASRGATASAVSALPPASSQARFEVSLNGIDLGDTTPTAEGESLPLPELAQSLGVTAFRTGAQAVNLQSAAALDGGIIPPVILNPERAVLPASALGPFSPSHRQSVPDSAIVNRNPGSQAAINDWGRLAGYSVVDTQKAVPGHPGLLPDPLEPAAVLLSATEYSTESGATAAIHVYAKAMAGVVKGTPLTLGDLNGPHGQGPVIAAVKVTGKGAHALRAIWFLTGVDNWEVEVACDGPALTFHLRNAWPVLEKEVAYIESGARSG